MGRCQPGNGKPHRRATDIGESDGVAELNRFGMASVLTAYFDLEIGLRLSPPFDSVISSSLALRFTDDVIIPKSRATEAPVYPKFPPPPPGKISSLPNTAGLRRLLAFVSERSSLVCLSLSPTYTFPYLLSSAYFSLPQRPYLIFFTLQILISVSALYANVASRQW